MATYRWDARSVSASLAGSRLAFLIIVRAVGVRWWLFLTQRSREYHR